MRSSLSGTQKEKDSTANATLWRKICFTKNYKSLRTSPL
ncbi:hypothetical protein XBKB1_4330001 [Xenorhabdus bovienii str. kraussei Becker Underwood]|uniref:Uncharacterized protein n=1 Tax=Xenorhabdus bovienii str. kraussei Becker Underwood TaxID=1398204 RepID=A0A077PZC1_XENBV|nr:hypothetical protein XBKB1_4330001 [Xenorhabdus bovienii str. kraussei Becker Underwood]